MIGFLMIGSCQSAFAHKNQHKTLHVKNRTVYRKLTGIASFYGPGFWGHHTSSGRIMRPRDMTVAHRTLPLGTRLRVTNMDNGHVVMVTVNDRGPYVGHRLIDLAEKPARLLNMKHNGLAHVSIQPVFIPNNNEVAEYVAHERKYH